MDAPIPQSQLDSPGRGTAPGIAPTLRCLLIFAVGIFGGWLGILLGKWIGQHWVPLLRQPGPAQQQFLQANAGWLALVWVFLFVVVMYGSLELITRWQIRRSQEIYRRRLHSSGLLERLRSGTADYGLAHRVIARQPWLIRSNFKGFPEPVGDPWLDVVHVGLFLDMHLEGGRNQRLWLRPAPVFMFVPGIVLFLDWLSWYLRSRLAPELSVISFGITLCVIISIWLSVNQAIRLGFEWQKMLLKELGPEYVAEMERRIALADAAQADGAKPGTDGS